MGLEKEIISTNTESVFQPAPPDFSIPPELTKQAIRNDQKANGGKYLPNRWNRRGKVIEYRGTNILREQKELFSSVEINPKPDEAGYDSLGYGTKELDEEGFFFEFKSSWIGVQDYKQKIRDKLPEGKRDMDGVREYMTANYIVLVNCSDIKSPEAIMDDSVKPQIKRIKERRLLKGLIFLNDLKAENAKKE